MPALLALLTPRMWFFGAIALLLVGLGLQTLRLDHAKTALAVEVADRASVEAVRERAAREHVQEIARIQADHAAATQALADAYAEDLHKRDSENAGLAADGDSLRADVERLTAAHPPGSEPDATACRRLADQAVTLGRLFGDADRLAEKLAGIAEQRNAEVRTLKRQLAADRLACTSDKGAIDGEANR
jgi:hypothetical protein